MQLQKNKVKHELKLKLHSQCFIIVKCLVIINEFKTLLFFRNELQKKEGVKVMYSVEFMTLNEKIFQSYVLLERLSPDDIQNLL